MLYARKRIRSGPMLEDLYYPIQPSGRLEPGSIPKKAGTTEAQERYNAKKAEMQAVRYVNANFDTGDIWMSPTYSDNCTTRPRTYEEATRRIQAYIRRVKRWRKKNGLPEMRYLYSVHEVKRKTGKYKGELMYHYHLFMSEMDRNAAEELWTDGAQVNADRFDPWMYDQEAAAKYGVKGSKKKKADGEREDRHFGRKGFVCSRNCKKPEIPKTQKRMNISKRRAEEMATAHVDDAAYWQGTVPEGYVYTGMQYVLNEWNGHYYWRVTYRRLPEWNTKKKKRKRGKKK